MRDTSDAPQGLRLVSETHRDAGDVGDGRRSAHNPATSVCGFIFNVVLSRELKDPRRWADLRSGWLQNRLPLRRPHKRRGLAAVGPLHIFTGHQPLVLIQLGSERLVFSG